MTVATSAEVARLQPSVAVLPSGASSSTAESGHALLVRHRWRGWVPPGGAVEPAETPREAARRELFEETGIRATLLDVPATVSVRSYRADWAPTLGLSYAAVIDISLRGVGESHQPVAWIPLDRDWEGAFPEDRPRVRAYARRLANARTMPGS